MNPNSPAQQDDTGQRGSSPPKEPSLIPNVAPTPPSNDKTETCGYPRTPWWKTLAELIGISAVIAYAIVSYFQWQAQIQNMRIDQRAWVGVVGVKSFDFKVGPGFSIPFDMTNSGKTPALNVHSEVALKSVEKEKEFVATYDEPRPLKPSFEVVQPQMHMILSTLPTDVSDLQFGDIENFRGILYGYGKITYNDIFGKEHHTTFCVMYWHGLSAPIACERYNTAD